MHPISTFTPYLSDERGRHSLTGDSILLFWSRPTGYFISKLGFLSDFDSVNIVGIKEE